MHVACCTNCGTRKGINLNAALAIKIRSICYSLKIHLCYVMLSRAYLWIHLLLPMTLFYNSPAEANVPLLVQQAMYAFQARICHNIVSAHILQGQIPFLSEPDSSKGAICLCGISSESVKNGGGVGGQTYPDSLYYDMM